MIRLRDVFFYIDHNVLCRARRVRRPGALSRRTAAPHMSVRVLGTRRAGPPTRVARRALTTTYSNGLYQAHAEFDCRARIVSHTNASAMWLAAVHPRYPGSIVLEGVVWLSESHSHCFGRHSAPRHITMYAFPSGRRPNGWYVSVNAGY